MARVKLFVVVAFDAMREFSCSVYGPFPSEEKALVWVGEMRKVGELRSCEDEGCGWRVEEVVSPD